MIKEITKRAKENNRKMSVLKMVIVAVLIAVVLLFTYLTGGSKGVYLHLMYIPIIISSFFWNAYVGLLTGLLSGILAGPLMPLDVSAGIMQEPANWLSRVTIFLFIGFFTGYLFQRINKLNSEAQQRSITSLFYNLPNERKMILDIEEQITSSNHFKIVSIKLTNLDGIEIYVDSELVFGIVENLAKQIEQHFGTDNTYSIGKDQLAILTNEQSLTKCEEQINQIVEYYSMFPLLIKGHKIGIALKVGIYEYSGEALSATAIYNKARIALEQGEQRESGTYKYDLQLEIKRKEQYDIAGALLESIRKEELFLMYQPKIDLKLNKITGVEVLVRWHRDKKNLIAPDIFIPIAEEIGMMTDVTKFVFENATTQVESWRKKGIDTQCAFNLSAKELLDKSFRNWSEEIVTTKGINRSHYEIEITERSIDYDNQVLIQRTSFLKDLGYKISIDDFGTGYNSFVSIVKIPYDIIKIDKYFVDRIEQQEIKEFIRLFVNYSHNFGKKVVAEGVETEKQLLILKELNCDEVQGYYFSKPLLPNDFEEYYQRFNFDNTFSQTDLQKSASFGG